MYQVKFTDSQQGIRFGIVQPHHEQAEELEAKGQSVVEDILTGQLGIAKTNDLIEVPYGIGGFGNYDTATGINWGGNEINDYLTLEQLAHEIRNLRNPEGIHKHSTFFIGVADGSAAYVVTKVKRVNCDVEWRGYCPDRWVDRMFGYGGSFRKKDVERVGGGNVIDKLFGNTEQNDPDAKLAIFQEKYADYIKRFNVCPEGTLADLLG